MLFALHTNLEFKHFWTFSIFLWIYFIISITNDFLHIVHSTQKNGAKPLSLGVTVSRIVQDPFVTMQRSASWPCIITLYCQRKENAEQKTSTREERQDFCLFLHYSKYKLSMTIFYICLVPIPIISALISICLQFTALRSPPQSFTTYYL